MEVVYSGPCPTCAALVMWNGEGEPHICAECETGRDFGLSKYEETDE